MNAGLKNTIVYLFVLAFASIHCHTKAEKLDFKSPDGYNMRAASQFKLPLELDEISGVAYYAADSSIFAINDEKGWLYKIKKGVGIETWEFFNGADFEDVVLLDSIFYHSLHRIPWRCSNIFSIRAAKAKTNLRFSIMIPLNGN